MKKEKSLVDLIDFLTAKCVDAFKWLGKMSRGKNTTDTIYIFTKIILTLLLLGLLDIPFVILKNIGVSFIYLIGSTFRGLLSTCLRGVLNISYLVLCLIIFLKVFNSILKNKELNIIEENRKKDTKVKKKLFEPLIKFVKACLIICIFLILIIMAVILVFTGMNLYLIINGDLIFSPLFMFAGILVILYAAISSIYSIIEGSDE